MSKLILHSHAKLNLYLKVINKRQDNYHNIETIFERISLADTIILKERRDNLIRVICSSRSVPSGNSNLAYQSAKLLQDGLGLDKGVDIKIAKRIPVGSGMGGGSSDAASVLLGLNIIWKLKLNRRQLLKYAKRLGSDVPFFLYDSSFALGTGRGDLIRPLTALNGTKIWHVLVVPRGKVSTPFIYEQWDRENCQKSQLAPPVPVQGVTLKGEKAGLTRGRFNVKLLPLALIAKDFFSVKKLLFNSLQETTSRFYPKLRRIATELNNLGAESSLMSGSGPAVFAIVSSRKEAVVLGRQVKKSNKAWQVFVVRTQ